MKGMNLQEFKETLEGDAQKRCKAQEQTIKDLHSELKSKDDHIETLLESIKKRDHTITMLQNRCFAQTRGLLCMFCGYKHSCQRSIGK